MNSLAIISDIHGNYPALRAVLEDIDRRGVTQIICLGDLVGYYCFHNEVTAAIRSREIPCLMGNHDHALVCNEGVIERSRTCTRILRWQLDCLEESERIFLSALPARIDIHWGNRNVVCVHGGLKDPVDEYLFDVTPEYLADNEFQADALISGHTHLPAYRKYLDGKLWLNPGSVGQPRDGDNRASYALVSEDWNITFARVSYDYQSVVDRMAALKFDAYISDPLVSGKKIGL